MFLNKFTNSERSNKQNEINWSDLDIEKYFDTVNHDKLISILRENVHDSHTQTFNPTISNSRNNG